MFQTYFTFYKVYLYFIYEEVNAFSEVSLQKRICSFFLFHIRKIIREICMSFWVEGYVFFFTPELIVALLHLCFLFVNYLMSFFPVGFLNLLIKPISDSFYMLKSIREEFVVRKWKSWNHIVRTLLNLHKNWS